MKFNVNKKIFSNFLGFFFKGILLVAPFYLTISVISIALQKVDNVMKFTIPGIGLLIVVILVTLLGYLGSTIIVRSIFEGTENFIGKLPLINTIYYALKDLFKAFVGNKKNFDRPVLVKINTEAGMYKLGFITQRDLKSINMVDYISVYVPHSYALSGDLFILPKGSVTPIDVSGTEVTKFIISGGLTAIKNLKGKRASNDVGV